MTPSYEEMLTKYLKKNKAKTPLVKKGSQETPVQPQKVFFYAEHFLVSVDWKHM